MRLPENLKEILRKITKTKEADGQEEARNLVDDSLPRRRDPDDEDDDEEEIHSLPAGAWPKQGPRPGWLGTLLYYCSLTLTLLGILTLLKSAYIKDSFRPPVLLLGCSLLVSGLLSLNVANWLYNREQKHLVEYLQSKISEMMLEHKTRMRDIV